MSSRGVKVSDSGAMPPGTIRNCQSKHWLENCSPNPVVSLNCQYHRNECQMGSEQSTTRDERRQPGSSRRSASRERLIYELHQLYNHNTREDKRQWQENTITVLYLNAQGVLCICQILNLTTDYRIVSIFQTWGFLVPLWRVAALLVTAAQRNSVLCEILAPGKKPNGWVNCYCYIKWGDGVA